MSLIEIGVIIQSERDIGINYCSYQLCLRPWTNNAETSTVALIAVFIAALIEITAIYWLCEQIYYCLMLLLWSLSGKFECCWCLTFETISEHIIDISRCSWTCWNLFWLSCSQEVAWRYLFALITLFAVLLKDAQRWRGILLSKVTWRNSLLLVERCVRSVVVTSDAKNARLRLRLARKRREDRGELLRVV